jgi:hypothetical protein
MPAEHVARRVAELAAALAHVIAHRRLRTSAPCSSTRRRQIRFRHANGGAPLLQLGRVRLDQRFHRRGPGENGDGLAVNRAGRERARTATSTRGGPVLARRNERGSRARRTTTAGTGDS